MGIGAGPFVVRGLYQQFDENIQGIISKFTVDMKVGDIVDSKYSEQK